MANLTLTIDEEMLKRARIKALQQGTSVNALVREYLAVYTGVDQEESGILAFLAFTEQHPAGEVGTKRTWAREDLYEERTRWPRS